MCQKSSNVKSFESKTALDLRIILDGQFYTEDDTTFFYQLTKNNLIPIFPESGNKPKLMLI